jgi:hypothetical protein
LSKKNIYKTLGTIIISVISTILVLVVGAYIQIKHIEQTTDYCELQYGKNNFLFVETTGTGSCKDYIGQCWECIKIVKNQTQPYKDYHIWHTNDTYRCYSQDSPTSWGNCSLLNKSEVI